MSFEPWLDPGDRHPTIEQRFTEQTERERRTADRLGLDRFAEMPLQCDDCGKIEEPGESFEDDWVSDVLCPGCIDRRLEQSEKYGYG